MPSLTPTSLSPRFGVLGDPSPSALLARPRCRLGHQRRGRIRAIRDSDLAALETPSGGSGPSLGVTGLSLAAANLHRAARHPGPGGDPALGPPGTQPSTLCPQCL